MEQEAFELLHDAESSWWYQGRALVVRRVLQSLSLPKGVSILDFGAGFGGMHDLLATFGGVSALEIDEQASKQASQKGYERVYFNSHDALARTYDLIALFDVLEHIEDDAAFCAKRTARLLPREEWCSRFLLCRFCGVRTMFRTTIFAVTPNRRCAQCSRALVSRLSM